MPVEKSRSRSGRMPLEKALKVLGLTKDSSIEEINRAFKSKLADYQRKYADQPDKLVQEGDILYSAYRSAYEAKGGSEEEMLQLELEGPDAMLNMFGIHEVPHQSLKVQMQSQAHYKDGQLVKKESSKTESFVNSDGKREIKVYENGKLIKHTIDGKNMLK